MNVPRAFRAFQEDLALAVPTPNSFLTTTLPDSNCKEMFGALSFSE